MPALDLYSMTGDKIGTVDVDESIFGIEPNKAVMHEVLVAELAAARQGTASTKTRAMVRGGGRKPFKQKGTGRARQGSIREPHMVGGGVAFGPHPRSYEKKVNKKARLLALKSTLSEKAREGNLVVVDNFEFEVPKTKTVLNFLDKIESKKQLFVLKDFIDENNYNTYMSARNIRDTMVLDYVHLGVFWLLKQDKVILTKDALEAIQEVLA